MTHFSKNNTDFPLKTDPPSEAERSLEWAKLEISKPVGQMYYGSVTLWYERGIIKRIECVQSKKPPYSS